MRLDQLQPEEMADLRIRTLVEWWIKDCQDNWDRSTFGFPISKSAYIRIEFIDISKERKEAPKVTRHPEQPLAWGHEIHDWPKCVYCGKPPHIGICPENTRGY